MRLRSKNAALLLVVMCFCWVPVSAAADDPKNPDGADGTDGLIDGTTTESGKLPYETFDERLKSSHSIAALGSDLFGDSVSLQNGGLSFQVTDVSIPGNSALPVAFTRRYEVINHKDHHGAQGMLGDWDLVLPNISGSFASASMSDPVNWISSGTAGNRCSDRLPPPAPHSEVSLNEFWHGLTIEIPGVGGGELLRYDPVDNPDTPVPVDGNFYKWVTNDHIRVYCGSVDNHTGEGFIAVTPDGTTYTFSHMAQYFEPTIEGLHVTAMHGTFTTFHPRRKSVLLATRIRDRFGNEVVLSYNNAWNEPARLTRIDANDGRFLVLTYLDGRVSSVSDGTRQWTYTYATTPNGRKSLDKVTLPDNVTQWDINFETLTDAEIKAREWGESDRTCRFLDTPLNYDESFVGNVVHPSGAAGQFALKILEHGRSNVPLSCGHVTDQNNAADDINTYAISAYSLTLVNKAITGAGLSGLTWGYSYEPGIKVYLFGHDDSDPSNDVTLAYPVCDSDIFQCDSPPPCTDPNSACSESRTIVDGPGSEWTRYTFGNSFRYNEGKLLKIERGSSAENVLETTSHTYDLSLANQGYPASFGSSTQVNYDGNRNTFHRPLLSTSIMRQDVSFTWEVDGNCPDGVCANMFAQPEKVTRYSTLGYGRTEATSYLNDLDAWVIGQVERVTCVSAIPATPGHLECDNTVVAETTFDPITVLPELHKSFGKTQYSLNYHADGTLRQYIDGRGNITQLANWFRGVPQSIDHPDVATDAGIAPGIETAVVSSDGSITSVTNEVGAQTCYQYDDLGRLETITYPSESTGGCAVDSPWAPTIILYSFGPTSYLDGGSHWQQTVQTGDSTKTTRYDAFWRPAVVQEYKSGVPSTTSRYTAFKYDHAGRTTFAAYPGASWPLPLDVGVHTDYDSLGRVTSVSQTAEPNLGGSVTTTTSYLTGFQTSVLNPRHFATITHYMGLDQPTTDWPVRIEHSEGAVTTIARDALGKPLSITRGNLDASVSVARSYVYNLNQELCKRIEPETGVSVSTFDGVGNLDWSASGQALNHVDCSDLTVVPASDRVHRVYDERNRLNLLAFSDGNGDQEWTYHDDGLPNTVTTWNDEGLSWVDNQYTFNKRRLLIEETQTQPDQGNEWSIAYRYDARGFLDSHQYPDGTFVAYAPDHLGRATQVGTFATNATYHPSGALAGFVFGNEVVHTMTPNERQLPQASRDYLPGAGDDVHHDVLGYDENGNVALIGDQTLGHLGDRVMSYDGLDRLRSTLWTSRSGVSAAYEYDVLDNLTRVRAPYQSGDRYYCYAADSVGTDAVNRLARISDAPCDQEGTAIVFAYDSRGNLDTKDGSGFMLDVDFDYGNRLRVAVGDERYRYDAHGRRIQATNLVDQDIFSVYGQDGVLRYQLDERRREATSYFYLAGSLVARARTALAAAGPVLSAGTVDTTTGDFALSWSATGGNYLLDESADGGETWLQVADTTLTSWSADNKGNGTYQYRVRGCNPDCSGFSNVVSVAVVRKPTQTPAITQPTFGGTELHAFTVAWTSVQYAAAYQLQQRYDSGIWTDVPGVAGTSKAITVSQDGTYEYQVRGCSSAQPAECGPYSDLKVVAVGQPALSAPQNLATDPAQTTTGTFTVSWSSVSGAVRYELEEASTSAGPWTDVPSVSGLSKAFTKNPGSYFYRVAACSGSGDETCGGYSAVDGIDVLPAIPILTVPQQNTTGSYSVSWSAVAYADEYMLEEKLDGASSWSTAYSGTNLDKLLAARPNGTHSYRVKSRSGSLWSAVSAVKSVPVCSLTLPSLTAPEFDADGAFTVSWPAGPSCVTSHRLDQAYDGGAWNQVTTSGASKSFVSLAVGRYDYRVQTCFNAQCTAYSEAKTVCVGPPKDVPDVSAPSISASGDYTVAMDLVDCATSYRLQEAVNSGNWAWISTQNNGFSLALVDKSPANYRYRGWVCNSNGCGGFSDVVTVEVGPPTEAPVISAPATSTGSYTVSWTAVARADDYRLQESINNGTWSTVTVAGLSKSYSNKAAGSYRYRVRGRRGTVGPVSNTVTVVVSVPPTSPPATPTGLVVEYLGPTSCMATWNASTGADRYELQRNNVEIYDGSDAFYWYKSSCSGTFKVRACNAAGCSAYSAGVAPTQPNQINRGGDE